MSFRKVERSYHSTPHGWRLATYEEAKNGLETIKKKNLLRRWDRARLLDGWVTGPAYNFEIGDDYKGCLGYMLLIQTQASGAAYADVNLSDRGKEVALLLCVDDWNYEVVYWLLNSWSNTETMNVREVSRGNIPFSNVQKFDEMNKLMGYVARRLGEEEGKALEKSGKKKYSGSDSVKEVLSGMINIVAKEGDVVQLMGRLVWKFLSYELDESCLPDSVKKGHVDEPFWNFVCDSFAGYVIGVCAFASLQDIRKMKTTDTAQNDWRIATSILFHLSNFLVDIIHEPMAHNCIFPCTNKVLSNAAQKAAGNTKKCSEMLKNNAMWRCYDDTRNYGVLDKLLVLIAKSKYNDIEEADKLVIIDMLLQCGSQPRRRHAIGKYKNKTVLHSVAKFRDEDVGTEVAQALLCMCDERDIYDFVNAEDERGRTALHRASQKGNARICRLLVDCGAVVKGTDKRGMTALHYAFEKDIDKVIDVETEIAETLLDRCDEQSISELVNSPDESGRCALHRASERGNAIICKLLVERGASMTARDNNGMTALHYAFEERIDKVSAAGIEIANALLDRCEKKCLYEFVNASDSHMKTALHGASERGNADICKRLIDCGALVTVEDKVGMTALHRACERKKDMHMGREITEVLLSNCKCDEQSIYKFVNAAEKRGSRTALHGASEKGDTHICKLLLEKGASVTAKDRKDMTALHYAFEGDTDKVKNVGQEIVTALISKCDEQDIYDFVNSRDDRGRTALHRASERGNIDICKQLVDRRAKLTTKDKEGMTALHCAFEGGIIKVKSFGKEIVNALLNWCDEQSIYEFVNTKDNNGRTALHRASESGSTEICELLVDNHAQLTAQDKKDLTALHYAFEGDNDKVKNAGEIVKALLSRCHKEHMYSFVNTTDERGRTALHCASDKGNLDSCQLLVDHCASLAAPDKRGMTALHYAFVGGFDKVTGVGIEIAQALLKKCDEQSRNMLVNAVDEKGRTALHNVSEKGNARICRVLIDHGATVTFQDRSARTALHYAFEVDQNSKDINVGIEIAETLLDNCDNQSLEKFVNIIDEAGKTALHSASQRANGHICGLLVDRQALLTTQDKDGMTALHYAFESDVATEIAETLLLRCDKKIVNEFVNAADVRGRTALHRASEKGDSNVCGLLVNYGALITVQDRLGKTALHYALEGRMDEVIDVLVKSPNVTDSLELKDYRGYTPLGIALTNMDDKSTVKLLLQSKMPENYLKGALANMNYETMAKLSLKSKEPDAYLDIALPTMDYESTAKLLSKLNKPKAHFYTVDQEQLLRSSLLLGFEKIVVDLWRKGIRLPARDCDEDGKTALHLAAMCDNERRALRITQIIIGNEISVNVKNMVAKLDSGRRTVLHEAALNGHTRLCRLLLNFNSELIYMKDRQNRNPLYDAVEGNYTGTALYKHLLTAYLRKDMGDDDLMDRNGLTPLQIAASQGKVQVVKEFLSSYKIKTKYLSRGDIIAQTALHKAVTHGHIDTVEVLLKHGAEPLLERDRDGRTALHYAVQAKTEKKDELARMILGACQTDKKKSLLLWAHAAGIGTADQDLKDDDPLHIYLAGEREKFKESNLLIMAASLENIEMTKELISRGYRIGDIMNGLQETNGGNVNKVLKQIQMIKDQGNDKPAISDSLGRLDYSQGLAALFLNPYIKPPIAVGLSGSWGTGKSSLMLQTERILLTTAAKMALVPSSKLPTSALELPGIRPCELSEKGKGKCKDIHRQMNYGERANRNIFVILWDYIRSKVRQSRVKDIQQELEKILTEYEEKLISQYDRNYLKVFKALAAMDSSEMSWPKGDPSIEENVQAVLTVQYNAWKYRNDTEALAGLAVEITKELEGIMTSAQWFNTCWRNTWINKKYTLWIEIFFPSILALVLVCSLTWIVWVVFDSHKLKEWGKAKYAWPPAAIIIIVWTLTKSIMGVLKPVSTQLLQCFSFPDHTDKLGYQERVISDISFLKGEIGQKAHWVFIVFAWVLNVISTLWSIITESLLFHHRSHEQTIRAPQVTPASGSNLRIIVFVDDLDRCQESVILQVLSAVNLVLAVCEISVVIGMDTRLIERAIIKKYKDVNSDKSLKANRELADMYLQKIIQLPLDLPDPSDEELKRFLRGQLGVLENENPAFEDGTSRNGGEEGDAVEQNAAEEVAIDMQASLASAHTRLATIGNEKPSSSSLVREMLFVRYYSKGEEEAFLYFQGLATDCRKHPREWKRLLNYHRLVWYIFSVSKEASKLGGWQVQLVTWIFICWEWQECINLVIKNWKEIDPQIEAVSLFTIVKHLMEEHDEFIYENSENCISEKRVNAMTKKLGELEKSLAELKREMKEIKTSGESKKEMKELENIVSSEMKEDIEEVKEQIVKIERGKKCKKRNEDHNNKLHRENWDRLKSTLNKYNVSMDAIQAFQRFRFYCIAGYLARPGKDIKNGRI